MRKEREEQGNNNSFTVLFTSLSVLVLAFFIYLVSVSTIDESRHRAAYDSVLGAFGLLEGQSLLLIIDEELEPAPDRQAPSNAKRLRTREDRLRELAEKRGLSELVEIKGRGVDLIVRFQEEALFEPGSAKLNPDASELLLFIGEWAKVRSLDVSIEGHTDDVPICTDAFPSNWELSARRAVSVLRFLAGEAGVPEALLSARGYGSGRPLADNSTPEGRAKNRRVEVVLLGAKKRYARPGFWSWFDLVGD